MRPSGVLRGWLAAALLGALGLGALLLLRPAQPRSVRLGFWETPPYLYYDRNGVLSGSTYRVFEEAAARAKLKLVWVKSAKLPEQALLDGDVDLWQAVMVTEARKRQMTMTPGWIHVEYVVVARPGGFSTAFGGRGMTIATVTTRNDSTIHRELLPQAKIREFPDRDAAIRELCQGNVNGLLATVRAMLTLYIDPPCPGQRVEMIRLENGMREVAIGAAPGMGSHAAALRYAMGELAREGRVKEIYSRGEGAVAIEATAFMTLTDSLERERNLKWLLSGLGLMSGLLIWQMLRLRATGRRMASALQVANAASQAKSDFLSNMSHEIRTPISGVLGLMDLLLQTPLDPPQREYAEMSRQAAGHLRELVSDILDFSRIEAGRTRIRTAPASLREIIRGVVETLRPEAVRKNLELTFQADPSLPDWFLLDEGHLRQVLMNLCGNALKFTDSGFVRVQASARPLPSGETAVRVTVTDSGIGIEPAHQARIFERFEQSDASTTRRFGGTGLGLTISRALIEMMNGTIGVESRAGEGATFWFEIPVRTAEKPADSVSLPELATLRPGRVLVVEDNAVNQLVARRVLERLGYATGVASDGAAAIRIAGAERFDAVLMDCQMPVMDGMEATRQLRRLENCRTTPIIAVTANALESVRAQCMEAGMNDFLSKPYTIDQLKEVLHRWLGGRLDQSSTAD